MNKLLSLLLVLGLVFLVGCTGTSETGQAVEGVNPNPAEDINQNTSDSNIRLNCRELGGYLCSHDGSCTLEWLDSSDSYCCPINCGTCPANVSCDDNNNRTDDSCVLSNGKPKCQYIEKECDYKIASYTYWLEGDGTITCTGVSCVDNTTKILLGKPLTFGIEFRPEMFKPENTRIVRSGNVLSSNEIYGKLNITVRIFGVCKEDGQACPGTLYPEGYFKCQTIIEMPNGCTSTYVQFETKMERTDCLGEDHFATSIPVQ